MPDTLERLHTALSGRYTIERELGRGGMAVVYLARDDRHGRRVAVKVLYTELSAAVSAERFQREIAIAASLTHPNILPLYEAGECEGSLYYVMPYVEGETLQARLAREQQLPIDDAVAIACEVAGALDYAHRHGVVHRDIKPANILLEDGHAVLADFGLARAVSRATKGDKLTQTGVTLGTPLYMSPEQASGTWELDGRSDIYALGCVTYEMLVGEPPFTGPNVQAVMARHVAAPVPSMRTVRRAIPRAVEEAVLCALEKSPADRFTSGQQFASALACGAGGTAGVGYRHAGARVASRTLSPRARAIALGASLFLLAGAAAWWAARAPTPTSGERVTGLDARRIAVLYFDDGSPDRSLGYLADGLSESLMESLERVQGLHVISRSGVERFRDSVDLARIASVLQAGTLVRGSLEPVGDRVRVVIRLADGSNGAEYQRAAFVQPLADVLSARDSVAEKLALMLRPWLGDEIRLQRERSGTASVAAWSHVQRAKRVARDADALARARDTTASRSFDEADSLLARAEQLDPAWIVPTVARGELALRRLPLEQNQLRVARIIDAGVAHADRALRADPRNADALAARGALHFNRMVRVPATDAAQSAALLRRAKDDLTAAVAIAPAHAGAWTTLSQLHYRTFNKVEANLAARRAYEADAFLSSAREILWRLYATSYDLEQFVDAASWCAEGQRRYPADALFVRCEIWLLTTNVAEPDVDSAWRLVARLDSLAQPVQRELLRREGQMVVAAAIGRKGMPDSARAVLLRARAGRDIDPMGNLHGVEAAVRTMIGDHDEAVRLLQQFLTANPVHREGFVKNNSWWWRPLREDPRFKVLMGGGA